MENLITSLQSGSGNFVAAPIDPNPRRVDLEGGPNVPREELNQIAKPKPRILIVADSAESTRDVRTKISSSEMEIECVKTQEEIDQACSRSHDVTIINLSAKQLQTILPKLRASKEHTRTLILVLLDRIAGDPSLAGLMPKYRAMPCSRAEMALLLPRREKPLALAKAARLLL